MGRVKVNGQHFMGVHDKKECVGFPCPFHNPSEHRMSTWPINMRASRLVERVCSHGVGHPDPDSVAWFVRCGVDHMGIHGCCGCCSGQLDKNTTAP